MYDFNGYFRISFNDFWHDGLGNRPDDRFRKLNINLKDTKKTGEYIIYQNQVKAVKTILILIIGWKIQKMKLGNIQIERL